MDLVEAVQMLRTPNDPYNRDLLAIRIVMLDLLTRVESMNKFTQLVTDQVKDVEPPKKRRK